MQIRSFIIICLLLSVLAVSCDFNKKEKCAKLDNEIATINDSLLWYGKQWGDELKVAVNTLDFSELQPIRMEMQAYVERNIEHVGTLENIGGSEELLATQIAFLEVEKNIVATRLSVFEQFTDSVSMEELSNAYSAMQMSAEREQELLRKIHLLREQYEERNEIPKFLDKY